VEVLRIALSTDGPDILISARDLAREFDGLRAVDGISFQVSRGETFGFLGPNGAGKTTTIKMLTAQLLPSGGDARVAGYDVRTQEREVQSRIGVVFELPNVYKRLSARDNLDFFARLYGVDAGQVDVVLERVGLSERADDATRHYSKGMVQRLLIARAILPRPEVLFLDEPTTGLDPEAVLNLHNLIRGLSAEGTTIFLTTHYMEEADSLCDRVAFIESGRLAAVDTPWNLKVKHGKRELLVSWFEGGRRFEETVEPGSPGTAKRLAELFSHKELSVHSQEATLEDVFIELTGKGLK
jgi:ABC-2 type transport system ATP-binding protein